MFLFYLFCGLLFLVLLLETADSFGLFDLFVIVEYLLDAFDRLVFKLELFKGCDSFYSLWVGKVGFLARVSSRCYECGSGYTSYLCVMLL